MDLLSKRLFKELEEMQQQTGKMLRNMSFAKMGPFETGSQGPPANIYETDADIHVYFDLAGADNDSLTVLAEESKLTVKGRREIPGKYAIVCIHQLELELGEFSRTVDLPSATDVDHVTSVFHNGILAVHLPKKQPREKIQISVAID
ncbi:MAG: Hsp20/alpha crystallin family protein [Desulfobulbaceae bacterium]|nr:Hsp20/alpha crystallin family protein [Desulfobulbaceae bacterium]